MGHNDVNARLGQKKKTKIANSLSDTVSKSNDFPVVDRNQSTGLCISCHYQKIACIWMKGDLQSDECVKLADFQGLPLCPCLKYVGPGQSC